MADYLVKYLFKNKWNLNEEYKPFTFTIPKIQKILLDDNKDLVLLQENPLNEHYRIFQHNLGVSLVFLGLNGLQTFLMYKLYKSCRIKKVIVAGTISSLIGWYEVYYAYSRIKDPYEIILKQGQRLCIKSYQDEFPYEIDIKDLRVVMKDEQDFYVFIDSSNTNALRFWAIEPVDGNVFNREVFKWVFEDRRYLNYKV